MKEKKEYPPNINLIRQYVQPNERTVFAYGDTLYNPHKVEIPPDLWVHEDMHRQQQEAYSSPDLWWSKYLLDPAFRLDQELEAYAAQYAYIVKHIPKAAKEALFDFASSLTSPMYALDLEHTKAESMIRLRSKAVL